MLRLTQLGEGTADTRRLATIAELARTPAEEADVRLVITELAKLKRSDLKLFKERFDLARSKALSNDFAWGRTCRD